MNDTGGIQVIARAARILRALEGEPNGLSFGELSKRLGLARSTVQRIVVALRDEQLLFAGGPRANVRLGSGLLRLASSVNIEIEVLARPIMQKLALETGQTVNLAILQGQMATFVDQILGSSPLIAMSPVGETHPLHSTAKGKALLACVDPARRRALLKGKLKRFTPATIVDTDELERQLEAFDRTQLVYDLEEHGEGVCAIGTSFIDPLGRSFALSIPMPATRFAQIKPLVEERLLAARQEIFDLVPGCVPPAVHST